MHDEAKKLYESGMSLVDIAKKYEIPAGTVRGWKSKERWNVGTSTSKRSKITPARVTMENHRPPFQPKNQLAVTHGLFARYLPEETRNIIEQMKDKPQIEILLEQIQLSYAAILRAQNIMYVKSCDDVTREITGKSSGAAGNSSSYLVQIAGDKQSAFLTAQAKAQTQLANMIKLYDDLSRSEMETEEQRARIDQIKANTEKVKQESTISSGSVIIPDAVWRGLMNDVYAERLTAQQTTQIFYGGSSSGKSFAILGQRTVRDVMTGKRNYLIVRKTARTLRNSSFNEVKKCICRMDLEPEFSINKSDMVITHRSSGCQILFCGLDDVEKVKSITPQIGVITDIVIEEATETEYNDYKSLKKRLRGGDESIIKRMVLLFNPILQDHWIYTEFFAGKWDDTKNYYADDKLLILRTTYKDNRWLTADDITKLEDETDKYYYDVYTLGKWGVLGNLIYTNWSTADLKEAGTLTHQFYNGLDFGFYPDPAAYLRIGYDRAKKTVYIFRELCGNDYTNDVLAEKLKPIIKREVLTCDSAEPKSIQELNNFGISAVPAVKGPGSLEFGIKWLKRQKIIVDKSCIETQLELKKYKYREDRNGNVLPEPVDKDNHLLDALRYALEYIMVETKVV